MASTQETVLGDGLNLAWSRGATDYTASAHGETGMRFMQPLVDMVVADVGTQLERAPKGKRNVLDVGSGPGEPGLSLAARHEDSTVTITDYSQGMVDLAQQRSKQLGLTNTSRDLHCAIFVMQWRKALAEWARVLQPGGYVAFSVWDSGERHMFSQLMVGVVGTMAKQGLAKPPPFKMEKFDDPEPVLTEMKSLGFRDVEFREFNNPQVASEADFVQSFMGNPMIDEWVTLSCGSDRAGFIRKVHEALLQAAAAQGMRQADGTYALSQIWGKYVAGRKQA